MWVLWGCREQHGERFSWDGTLTRVLRLEQDSQPGEIDLHGLYVKEAVKYADQSIEEARARGDAKIKFIVGTSSRATSMLVPRTYWWTGKGLHSTNHAAKIKPAIEELMQK